MGWKQITTGTDEVIDMLDQLGNDVQNAASYALYNGAGVMADAITSAVKTIKTAPFHYAAVSVKRLPSPEEKQVLLNCMPGIAKFDKNGTEVNTSIGFQEAGYSEILGRVVPVPLIANAINSGTSFMEKQPFFRRTVSQKKKQVQEEIKKAFEEYVEQWKKNHPGAR